MILSNWRMRASGRPSAALPDRCFAMLLDALPQTCGQLSEGIPGMVFASKGILKWSPNESQMAPRRPLGASWPLAGLLERSRRPLGQSWSVGSPKHRESKKHWFFMKIGFSVWHSQNNDMAVAKEIFINGSRVKTVHATMKFNSSYLFNYFNWLFFQYAMFSFSIKNIKTCWSYNSRSYPHFKAWNITKNQIAKNSYP